MHENCGQENDFPHIEWCIGKYPGLYTLFFKTSTWYQMFKLYQSYLVFLGYF